MRDPDSSDYVSRSPVPDPQCVAWDTVADHAVSDETARALRYMSDTESHTIIYLRELLATRAIDDPEIAEFFACWFYEETAHGRALNRFLQLSGHALPNRRRSDEPLAARLEAIGISWASKLWPHFIAVHMTWGAINELTAVTAYKLLAARSQHPVLEALLAHIRRDEARHFGFYYAQAEQRLAASPAVQRVTRALVERFWGPVGSGVQPEAETAFVGSYLFGGADGLEESRLVDRTIRRLPGFDGIKLLEAWVGRHVRSAGDLAPVGAALRQPPERVSEAVAARSIS